MTTDNGAWPNEYDDFINEAERDDRVGDHDAVVTEVLSETWPSGDPRYKVVIALTTAGNAKSEITFNEKPSVEQLAAIKASGDRKKIRGVGMGLNLYKALVQHYGLAHPKQFQVGQKVRVKNVKNKEGFIRTVALLPTGSGAAAEAKNEEVPF